MVHGSCSNQFKLFSTFGTRLICDELSHPGFSVTRMHVENVQIKCILPVMPAIQTLSPIPLDLNQICEKKNADVDTDQKTDVGSRKMAQSNEVCDMTQETSFDFCTMTRGYLK